MRRAFLAGILATLLSQPFLVGATLPLRSAYLGSEACAECHPKRYDGWSRTCHASVVSDPRTDRAALRGDFAQEGVGIDPESVEFVIGGHWYQRYATRVGGELYVLANMWSVTSHRWEIVDEWSWKRKPYKDYCIGCHATRYEVESGSYVEHRIGCEACHGPGRSHAESGGTEAVVNPGRWSVDERDLLCASCHVRGAEPAGRFPFALGYVPGEDLTAHYVPIRAKDGETARESLLRQFRDWRESLGKGPPPSCDVCGIPERPNERPRSAVSDHCLGCHEYGDDYSAHTRHPHSSELGCLHCHRRVALGTEESSDIHSPDYFRVHDRIRYETAAAQMCRGCHSDMSHGEVDRHLASWDHSSHLRKD